MCVCVCVYVYTCTIYIANALLYDVGEGVFMTAENKTGQLLGVTLFSNGDIFMVSVPILSLSLSVLYPFLLSLSLSLTLNLSCKSSILLSFLFLQACAPRWSDTRRNVLNLFPRGVCYTSGRNLQNFQRLQPCSNVLLTK